jgi:hypothetical protein
MAGEDKSGEFESTEDCEAAAWWPDKAGERLTMEPFRRGGEEGGDAVRLVPDLDMDATSADARPVEESPLDTVPVLVLVVELRRHRRRLRPLAVEAMLTESESRMRSGERNCDSGKVTLVAVVGLLGTVNARVLGVGAPAEVGEVWNSPVPVMMDAVGAGGTMVRPCPSLLLWTGGWAAWESVGRCICISGLTVDVVDDALGETGTARRGGAGGSAWFVRRREREDERETTLRTRSRRLPVEEDGVRGRVLLVPFTPRVFLDTGVGVGIPLSISSTEAEESL